VDGIRSSDNRYLTKPQLDHKFGGVFRVEHQSMGEAGEMRAEQDSQKIGKSGTDMGVRYTFMDNDQTILSVDLYQSDFSNMAH
jgi:hypothetical protein